jgi:antitoxin VapB
MGQTAKIFKTGRSQAVRLPLAYRFDTSSVFIRKDQRTGDVILSRRPDTWDGFLQALSATEVPPDFLDKEERQQGEQSRDPLQGWTE